MKQNVRVHNSQEKETEFSYGGLCSAQPTCASYDGPGKWDILSDGALLLEWEESDLTKVPARLQHICPRPLNRRDLHVGISWKHPAHEAHRCAVLSACMMAGCWYQNSFPVGNFAPPLCLLPFRLLTILYSDYLYSYERWSLSMLRTFYFPFLYSENASCILIIWLEDS